MTRGRFRIDRDSLRWRLPFVVVIMVGAVLSAFLWVTYRAITGAALQTAGARASVVADQISASLVQSTRQRITEARRLLSTPPLQDCLRARSETACQAARRTLEALPGSAPDVTELWTRDGTRLLTIARPATAAARMPSRGAPSIAAIGALQRAGDLLYAETAIDIHGPSPEGATTSGEIDPLLGYVVSRRPLAASPTRDLLNRLAGIGGAIKLGNTAGDVWTDLASAVAAPAINLHRPGVASYQSATHTTFVGALSPVSDTPWAVWVEFPDAVVLAPARTLLYRMLLIAAACLVVAASIVGLLGARFIGPLADLTDLAEAIAAGDYARRTVPQRRDEVGRLSAALNVMVERIDAMHDELETRVAERTASLATASTQLEARLQDLSEAQAETDRYFSMSRDLVSIATFEGRFLRVNPAWQDVLGWTTDELTTSPYLDFVHPEDRAATAAEASGLAAGDQTVRFSNRYRCKDGSYRWLSWQAVGHPDHQRIYATGRDVTEERRAAAALQRHVTELAEVNQELEAFSYSVSHDLRAPLRHVGGFAGLLNKSAGPRLEATERRHLVTIMDAATQMGHLIDDLLAFSRTSRTPLARQRVKLVNLVDDVRQEVGAAARDHDITWQVGPLPDVDADGALLRVVFVNLLSNAVKYTRTQPRRHIDIHHAYDPHGDLVVSIRDTGVGFEMAYAAKLFGVFQRLHRSEDFEGTGIGLATVRRIIQRHGGRTWAVGAVNEGATFSFSLPHGRPNGDDRAPGAGDGLVAS